MICAHCRTEFTPSRARLYCTKACARAVDRLRKQRAKPPEPDDDGRARPPVLVLSPDVLAAQPERLLPATHSPLWLLPAPKSGRASGRPAPDVASDCQTPPSGERTGT